MPLSIKYGEPTSAIDPSVGRVNLAIPVLAGESIIQPCTQNLPLTGTPDNGFQVSTSNSHWMVFCSPVEGKLESLTQAIYAKLFAQLNGRTCLRIWNFVPDINATHEGLENYQAFCLGRHRAYENHFRDGVREAFCAASAVGAQDNRLTVIALLTDSPVTHLENPLQCPAYEYPPAYGPKPPSFSRASLVGGEHPALYVSGTSAVTGSESVAPDNLAEQLRVTAHNLERILNISCEHLDKPLNELHPPYTRLYLRHAEHVAEAEQWLFNLPWVDKGRYMIVQADICRAELVAEVELAFPLSPVKLFDKVAQHAE